MTRAAMGHLNLVMIHPFSDGNGRMARALQTLVLAREGILAPSSVASRSIWGGTLPTTTLSSGRSARAAGIPSAMLGRGSVSA